MHPKSATAALVFLAANVREMRKHLDTTDLEIARSLVRGMRLNPKFSYAGARIHSDALVDLNGRGFDVVVDEVVNIVDAIESNKLVFCFRFSLFNDCLRDFTELVALADVYRAEHDLVDPEDKPF